MGVKYNMSFEMKHFFLTGMIVFTIVNIVNVYNFVANWGLMSIPNKFSSGAMIVFYCVLVIMFRSQYKQITQARLPSQSQIDDELVGL